MTPPSAPPTIRIHPADNVVIARRQLLGGTALADEGGLTVAGLVPPGHKLATAAMAAGEAVRRYNQVIGHATQAIAPGQHVHTHNLAFAERMPRVIKMKDGRIDRDERKG